MRAGGDRRGAIDCPAMRIARPLLVLIVALAASVATMRGQAPPLSKLLDPSALTETAPAEFTAVFDTTVGRFVIRAHRNWAPHGADRFYNLVKAGFYDQCRFFRVVPKFVIQWGVHGDPAVSAAWNRATLPIDRATSSNRRGRVTFAMGTLANTRTTQVFINLGDNSRLDIEGYAPFGEVTSSMILVERMYGEYGEGIDQSLIQLNGNAFLAKYFPRLDYVKKATIEKQ
jgi:peptidyl-prolyl cis-trans isomerase A (cyclophilin A)